ncbi:uncharacterized protein HMPREF1541_00049, partial [Cyphellophora europaea CBS 101466]
VGGGCLDIASIKDVAKGGAFDNAVKLPLEAAVLFSSPFDFNMTDIWKNRLDSTIHGATETLRSMVACSYLTDYRCNFIVGFRDQSASR